MPGYVMHIAIGKEYLRKHKDIDDEKSFIEGNIAPDLTNDKTKTHYGKSPTYTNLKEFLLDNKLDTSYNKGQFLHLITDYLFYNFYLEDVPVKGTKEILHNDYDCINKLLIKKYKIELFDNIKECVFYKEEMPKILTYELAIKIIEEISNLNIDDVKKEVEEKNEKWKKYKRV